MGQLKSSLMGVVVTGTVMSLGCAAAPPEESTDQAVEAYTDAIDDVAVDDDLTGTRVTTPYVGRSFGLSIGGVSLGVIRGYGGGVISADVIAEPGGSIDVSKKHLSPPKYEEITLLLDLKLAPAVITWITESWSSENATRDGAITEYDFAWREKRVIQFDGAVITKVKFPTCSGESKTPGFLTVTIAPQVIRTIAGSGTVANPKPQALPTPWISSNCRIDVAGVGGNKVNRVEAFTVVHPIPGEDNPAPKVEYSDLAVSMPDAQSAPWSAWHKQFVIQGMNNDGQEKTGTLSFLSADRMTSLLRVTFHNVGIYWFEDQQPPAREAEQILTSSAQMYTERVELQPGGSP